MFKHIRRALSATRHKSRSLCSRLAHKASFSSSLSPSGTLVSAESESKNLNQALAHNNMHLCRDPFEDVFPVVAGNNRAKASDNMANDFGAEVAGGEFEVVSYKQTDALDIGNKATDTGDQYSIPSVVYSDFDCPSMISLESSMDGKSSHGLGLASDSGGECSNIVTEYSAHNSSDTSAGSEQLEASVTEEKAKSYFNGLSERERTNLNSVLLTLINWDEGNEMPRLDNIRMHSVLRMTYYGWVRYGRATQASPLMAAAINLMGIENAMCWVLPMIEEYFSMHTSDNVSQ
ncbi:hypothetical protein H4S03_000755 [Coemansia sp. S3946]|nr:hypothetical protein H4S03_000755 [Coemansia sp. S3946]